jgi:hypothetical protein
MSQRKMSVTTPTEESNRNRVRIYKEVKLKKLIGDEVKELLAHKNAIRQTEVYTLVLDKHLLCSCME